MRRRLLASSAVVFANYGWAHCSSSHDADADDRNTTTTVKRYDSDPPPPDQPAAKRLVQRWTAQEEAPNYQPPDASWPPQRAGVTRRELPALRAAFEACGGEDHLREGPRSLECNEVTFNLAVALCGDTLRNHSEDEDEATEEEVKEGVGLMCSLADAGCSNGACGAALILNNGDVVEEDPTRAQKYLKVAAHVGHAQSMHELGTMHYLGDGVPENEAEAVRWFRRAAELGVSGSMYLLAECLYEGNGTPRDIASALGWFAVAGELGHRSARSRLASALRVDEEARYRDVAALRVSEWRDVMGQ